MVRHFEEIHEKVKDVTIEKSNATNFTISDGTASGIVIQSGTVDSIVITTGTFTALTSATIDGTATTDSIIFSGSGGQAYGDVDQWPVGSGGFWEITVGGQKKYIHLYTGTTM